MSEGARYSELNTVIGEDLRPKAGSLIITLFGDVISQHGDSVWLGSIIESLAGFGLNARQIRTAVSRLVQEDWLQTEQRGRRSYYSFTDTGRRRFERVANRIYAGSLPEWNGQWTFVFLALMESLKRDHLRRELSWQGFGQINPGVFIHPSANDQVLTEIINDAMVGDEVVVMRGNTHELTSQAALENTTFRAWKLTETQILFEDFCRRFSGVLPAVQNDRLSDQELFRVRLIVIHEYRRLLLKTTALPRDLLPKAWPGEQALEITAALYAQTQQASLQYITSTFESLHGRLPKASASYYQRFNVS